MVYDLAQIYSHSDDEAEELAGEGKVALCESARVFVDGSFDCRFTTYAFTRIRRAMISFCRTEGGLSTEWLARTCQGARKAEERLQRKYSSLGVDRPPTPDELAYVEKPYGDVTDDDVRRQAEHLRGTPRFVPLDDFELTVKEVEVENDFVVCLPPATRHIWSSLMSQMESTGNVSLSMEAERNNITREEVQDRLVGALRIWADIQG